MPLIARLTKNVLAKQRSFSLCHAMLIKTLVNERGRNQNAQCWMCFFAIGVTPYTQDAPLERRFGFPLLSKLPGLDPNLIGSAYIFLAWPLRSMSNCSLLLCTMPGHRLEDAQARVLTVQCLPHVPLTWKRSLVGWWKILVRAS